MKDQKAWTHKASNAPVNHLNAFYSCNTQGPGHESTDNDIPSRDFFYIIEKDGKKNYILGSIHVGKENIYPLNDIISIFRKI